MSEAAAPEAPAPAAPEAPAQAPAAAQTQAQAAEAQGAADAAQAAADNAQQKPTESDKDFEVRLSKLTREARIARSEAERWKGESAKAAEQLKTLTAELQKAKSKRMTTREFTALVQKINEAGDDRSKLEQILDDDGVEALPKAVREELEAARRDREERAAEKQRVAQEAARTKEIGIVGGVIAQMADECPLFEVFPGSAQHVLDAWHARWEEMGRNPANKPDVHELARELHEPLASNLVAALQSPKARSFLLAAKPELGALLGGQEAIPGGPERDAQGAGARKGPPATSATPVQPTTPKPKNPAPKTRWEQDREREEQVANSYREYQLELKRKGGAAHGA